MKRQAPNSFAVEARAAFVVELAKLDRYREIVMAEHRTVSQALRLHIDETIAKADAVGKLEAAARRSREGAGVASPEGLGQ